MVQYLRGRMMRMISMRMQYKLSPTHRQRGEDRRGGRADSTRGCLSRDPIPWATSRRTTVRAGIAIGDIQARWRSGWGRISCGLHG
jgi:hypothetical protein